MTAKERAENPEGVEIDADCPECGKSFVVLAERLPATVKMAIEAAVKEERTACAKIAEAASDGEDPHCCQPLSRVISAEIRKRGTP